jgi:uncharacterized RDD family membrane protein YckC
MAAHAAAPPYDPAAEPPAPPPAMDLASWWSRAGAAVVDFLVRVGIVAATAGIGALLSFGVTGGDAALLAIGGGLGLLIGWFVYAPLLMARWDGQTVGHRVSKTRVVMADGSRMSGGRAFVREALVKNLLMETIGGFTVVLWILNYLWPLWDDHNEALHDKLCRTRVITVTG